MKKLINGFNVEVVRANIYSDEVESKLFYNTVDKEWQAVSTVDKLALSYTVNGVLEVGNEYYRPENTKFLDHAFKREAEEAKDLGLDISVEDLKAIDTEIVTEFFNKAEDMIPTDLQYYNGEDELESLDKSVDHDIQLAISDVHYYKGVTFSFMPCTLSGEKVLSKLVINNEAVDFAVGFEDNNGDLIEDEGSKFYPYLETLLADSDIKDDIRQYIESVAFEHCLEFYNAQ